MNSNIEKLLYSRQDAAVALSVSLRSIDYLISDGKLTAEGSEENPDTSDQIRRFARGDHPRNKNWTPAYLTIPIHRKWQSTSGVFHRAK